MFRYFFSANKWLLIRLFRWLKLKSSIVSSGGATGHCNKCSTHSNFVTFACVRSFLVSPFNHVYFCFRYPGSKPIYYLLYDLRLVSTGW